MINCLVVLIRTSHEILLNSSFFEEHEMKEESDEKQQQEEEKMLRISCNSLYPTSDQILLHFSILESFLRFF